MDKLGIKNNLAQNQTIWKPSKIISKQNHHQTYCLNLKYLEEIYDKHSNIKSFLKETKKLDCSIYKDWGSDLVNKFLPYLIGMEWKIDTKPLEKPDISIEFLGNNKPKDLVIRGGNIINTISSPKYLYK
jgi:hypothetical protein